MKEELLSKYAKLIVRKGINVQNGQKVIIMAPIETAAFARLIAEICYKEGAMDVIMDWKDELFSRIRFLNAPEEVFETYPKWKKDMMITLLNEGAAVVSISAVDPEVYKGVDSKRVAKALKVQGIELKEVDERLMTNKNCWTVVSIPTVDWAKKVFPGLEAEEAVERLWEAILKTVMVDKDDPITIWEEHTNNLNKRIDYLNSKRFKYLHYKNSLGTDLKIELPEGHRWIGGADESAEGIVFNANMPTEEVFTLPKRDGINGTVVSAMPLSYRGNLIDNFMLTFDNGRIVDFKAEAGYEVLKELIETDEGSHYLGEVALVPYDSPIAKLGILFYNTLFDENASCHLAIGRAYTPCLVNYESYDEKDLLDIGVNDSLVHVDFMIGTKDLNILGITVDGEEIPVFIDGNFPF